MNKDQFFDLAEKYSRNECSKKEAQLFETFYAQMQQNPKDWVEWNLTHQEKSRLSILQKINRHIDSLDEEKREQTSKKRTMIWRVAASVTLIIGLSIGIISLQEEQPVEIAYTTYTTKNNQRVSITLADGTKVRLNSESSISLPKQFTADLREVELTGEAFFDVTKDPERPFVITSQGIKTTVLGTSFNVRAYESEDIDVTVAEGKVQVQINSRQPTPNDHTEPDLSADKQVEVLTPGQQALFSKTDQTLIKRQVDIQQYIGWTNTEFNFDMIPFEQVITTLERWYHKDIDIISGTPSEACLVRAKFKNEGLVPILAGLQNIVSFEYEDLGENKITIKNQGCIN